MTEGEWLACSDPQAMLEFLGRNRSERKLRLFAVACCRHLLLRVRVDPKDVHAVDVAERYADEVATATELDAVARYIPGPPSPRRTAAFACRDAASVDVGVVLADCTAENAAWAAGEHAASLVNGENGCPEFVAARAAEKSVQATLLRDIFGHLPSRPPQPIPALVLAWNDYCVVKMASAVYQDQAFAPERLGILADALEEAGCANGEILDHLREPGLHTRGCWSLDLLLGKE